MKKKINFNEDLHRFHKWQKKPYVVAPLSDQEHKCATCGIHYTGNFCPRCGQSQRIRRYSFKTAILNFLDVWGMGNRSMFRTIRDLILRPGYMIRDFLSGMQMAYFPPFKMFFLFFTFSLLVTNGLNIKGEIFSKEEVKKKKARTEQTVDALQAKTISKYQGKQTDLNGLENSEVAEFEAKVFTNIHFIMDSLEHFIDRFPNLFALMMLMLLSGILYFFFRHCPNIIDLRFSELFVAMIYIANMYLIFSITLNFFCIKKIPLFLLPLAVIPIKQLSGYSWLGTIWRAALAQMLLFISIFFILFLLALTVVFSTQLFG